MYIYKRLFTDEVCRTKIKKIIRKLHWNVGQINIYLICLAHNRDNFDIINSANLKQKGYPKKDLYIVGIAEGNESAVELSAQIYIKFLTDYGNTDFKEILFSNKEQLFRRY